MFYESFTLTVISHLVILACPVMLVLEYYRHRQDIQHLGLSTGMGIVMTGIGIIAGLYFLELILVYARSGGVSQPAVQELSQGFQRPLTWYASLGGFLAISAGLWYSVRVLIPKASNMMAHLAKKPVKESPDITSSNLFFQEIVEKQHSIQEALRLSEERFSQLVNLLPQTVFEVSSQGDVVYTNSAGCEMFKFSPQDVKDGLNISEYFDPVDRERASENFRRILLGEYLGANEYAMIRKDGQPLSAIITTRPIVREGAVIGAMGSIIDITERKKTERELEASQSMLRNVLDTIPVRVFWKDKDSNFLGCNIQFAKDAGFDTPKQLIGRNDAEISKGANAERYVADDRDVLESGVSKLNYEETRVGGNGEGTRWLRTSKIPLLDGDGEVFGILGCYEDITESRLLSQQLEYLASHDALTGLVNRREFEKRLSRVLESSQKDQSNHALCYVDLDQFKVVNDTCGHRAGDELLNQLGTVLQNYVRHRDTLARLGGDEFGVLMEHCTLQQAEVVAGKLREVVSEFRFTWEGRSFNIGASIGVVPIDASTSTITELLMKADAACYAAKDMGRNRIHVYSEDDFELLQRQGEMQWVSRIHEALENDRFVLYAQPIVPLEPNPDQGKHYEILTRLITEEGNLIRPGAFLPAVERFNLAPRLDRRIVEKSFTWLAGRPERLDALSMCSINLSGHSLGDEEFQNFISEQLEQLGIPAIKICFEITETAAISNLSRAIRFMEGLKDQGCRFALDDFGSGLSSFAYLRNLPVDYLKIDGMFITDVLDDPIDFAMVRSINEIGRLMGKKTIAEFVESEAIREQLEKINVDYVQGYGAGKPVPIDQIM